MQSRFRFLPLFFVAAALVLALSSGPATARPPGGWSVAQRIDQFGDAARTRLAPHYATAGVAWPGRSVALLAFKDARQLELHAQDTAGQWRFVRAYPIRAASGGPGPKLREGDLQVPEGRYRVTFLNANSAYHVSLRLDYPNAHDRAMARADGRTQLGGDIMIHGRAVSIGCLAMGDEAAEDLFTLAADIGMERMEVLIAPTDFRRAAPPAQVEGPAWLGALYASLATELARFPPGN